MGSNLVDIPPLDKVELCAQLFETEEVGVESATADFVATRLSDDGLTHSG